jgi:hypothetical protein
MFFSYNVWAVSGMFQISMGFGAMSFSDAKLLDVVWDVVSQSALHKYFYAFAEELHRLLAVVVRACWHW